MSEDISIINNAFALKVLLTKFISFRQSLEIKRYPHHIVLKVSEPASGKAGGKKKNYTINETAYEIIKRIDGSNTYEEVIKSLSSLYNEDVDSIDSKVERFLFHITNSYKLKIVSTDEKLPNPIIISFNEKVYPTTASIELTTRCNLNCIHCYGEYDDRKDDVLSLENAKKILTELRAIGVGLVEFTGGEITTHPNLKEIILVALELDFAQISLLTNGVALKEDLLDIIVKNKDKIIAQLDLHSLDDDYLKWFTKVPNTLERIKANIKYLHESGVLLRIATVVTPRNLNEIKDIAQWVYGRGIKSYAVSPVVNMGRAIKSVDDEEDNVLLNSMESINSFHKTINELNKKYDNFINIIEDSFYYQVKHNCGAMSTNVTISPKGDIKLCTMDNLDYVNSRLGNVLERNIKNIYDENNEFIKAINLLGSPKYNSDECKECQHQFFCGNCILRGFIRAKERGEDCKWLNRKVDQIIKKKLLL